MWRAIMVLAGCASFHTNRVAGDGAGDGAGDAASDATSGAIAVDASAFAKGMGVTSLTWSHTVSGIDRLLVVGVSWGMPDSAIVGVTYADSALVSLGGEANPTKRIDVAMYALVAPPIGAAPVVVTFAAATGEAVAGSVSFTGVDQTTPTRNFSSLHGPANPLPSVTLASAPTDVVMDTIVVDTNASSISPAAAQTQRWNVLEAEWAGASTKPGAATTTMGWHENGATLDDWALCAVSVHGH